jgi:phosphatidylglycerol:prolipoprotein diacylglycerol transferase
MWINNLNPAIITLGSLEIRWYGLTYVLGFFLSLWWMYYLNKKGKLKINREEILDFIFYLMLGVIIGSRLFEIFWEPNIYLSHPLELLKFWHGGMSFHGGLAGIIVAGIIYCKKKKLNFLELADALSFPALFALSLGRIANFINGELIGRSWNGKWCVIFPKEDSLCRHPYTIYAAIQRFCLSGWIFWMSIMNSFSSGFIFWNFILFEGVGRLILDYFREDILYFGLSLGQYFSLVMIIVALFFLVKRYKNDWKIIFS